MIHFIFLFKSFYFLFLLCTQEIKKATNKLKLHYKNIDYLINLLVFSDAVPVVHNSICIGITDTLGFIY